MRKILALFAAWGCTRLILGAYGCGVFRNDPEDVARLGYDMDWSRDVLEVEAMGEYEVVLLASPEFAPTASSSQTANRGR